MLNKYISTYKFLNSIVVASEVNYPINTYFPVMQ